MKITNQKLILINSVYTFSPQKKKKKQPSLSTITPHTPNTSHSILNIIKKRNTLAPNSRMKFLSTTALGSSVTITAAAAAVVAVAGDRDNFPMTVDLERAMMMIVTGRMTAGISSMNLIRVRQMSLPPMHHLHQTQERSAHVITGNCG